MSDKVSVSLQKKVGSLLPNFLIIAFFALLSAIYFAPAVMEGKDLFQNDVAGASGTAQDVRDHFEATGEISYWTNSLFSGMPMYQIAPSYPSLTAMKLAQDAYTLQWPLSLLPSYSWLLFAMLVGFFIFMRSLSVGRLWAVLGALMWAFSSYFIILIEAGHIWKLMVLAFIPPTIAGIVYIYKGSYLKGGIITAFFAALQLMSNHVQMSYYFAFLIVFMLVAYAVQTYRTRAWRGFLISSGVLALSAVVSIAINLTSLYHTYEYTQETMRGGSALGQAGEREHSGKGGLDKDYITQWSYGKAETLTLLVPNVYGGATGYLGSASPELLSDVPNDYRSIVAQMNHYWGDQPFTSGPVYVGAFVVFLFILGIFVVQHPIKWALLGATLLSVFLSWGHNMMWLTDWFIDYFPLYNKFRTVSSILVVAEFTIPTLAILTLLTFVQSPERVLASRPGLWTAGVCTIGLCIILYLVPGTFFDFLSDQEAEMFRSAMNTDIRIPSLMAELTKVRASIVSADALRSLVVLLSSLGVCYLFALGRLKQTAFALLLISITLIDLWSVDKRYLAEANFIDKYEIEAKAKPITSADREIALDKDPHYRVFNTSVGAFQDATTSAQHRSVGGYHAAKLSRYQDLIEHQLFKGNKQAFDALDTRYFVIRLEDGSLRVERNEGAYGPAWFVDTVHIASTAEEEMASFDSFDLRHIAVVGSDMVGALTALPAKPQGVEEVKLVDYTPNKAVYEVETDADRLLIFSEIYYPHGWKLTIDGEEAPILRANYLLRSALIPRGKHKVEMYFRPDSIQRTETIAYVAVAILLGAFLVSLYLSGKRIRNSKNKI